MKIYFTRHGETQWNTLNKICGLTDIDLTEKGISQAVIRRLPRYYRYLGEFYGLSNNLQFYFQILKYHLFFLLFLTNRNFYHICIFYPNLYNKLHKQRLLFGYISN